MAVYQELSVGVLSLNNSNVQIICGKSATRAAVLAETESWPSKPAIGSIYIGNTAGHVYIRVAAAGVAADWQVITSTAAD